VRRPGEVFVLDDGSEVDLDLGNYERFLDVTLTRDNNITTGKIYAKVIDAEVRPAPLPLGIAQVTHARNTLGAPPVQRQGKYLGKTVQGSGRPRVCALCAARPDRWPRPHPVIPHITDAIMDWVQTTSAKAVDGSDEAPDICIIEVCSPRPLSCRHETGLSGGWRRVCVCVCVWWWWWWWWWGGGGHVCRDLGAAAGRHGGRY
jgi:hypothetical protein